MTRILLLLLVFSSVKTFSQNSPEKVIKRMERERARMEKAEQRANQRTNHGWAPVFFYTPETNFAFGISHRMDRKPEKGDTITCVSTISSSVVYTLENQFILNSNAELFSKNNVWLVPANLTAGVIPFWFYGVGEVGPRENYGASELKFEGRFLRLVSGYHRVGVYSFVRGLNMLESDEGGRIDREQVNGYDGGWSLLLGPAYRFDSRDSRFAATHGLYFGADAGLSLDFGDRVYNFNSYLFDLRGFVPLGQWVVAGQSRMSVKTGTTPFYDLSFLGGDAVMRGYVAGYYRDQVGWTNTLELRTGYWKERFGLAGFISSGMIAPDLQALGDQSALSFGGGVRIMLIPEQRMNIRLDVAGTSDGTSGFYVGIGEAF